VPEIDQAGPGKGKVEGKEKAAVELHQSMALEIIIF
jgi:hypothetical protein